MKTLLVVEDEEPIRKGLEDAFIEEGFKVITADDGVKGYELVLAKKPDLLVLDIRLPGMNGLELCKKIRSESKQIPVIMLTAKSTETDKVTGLELGADDYVTKPFSVRELVSRVKALLRRTEKAGEKKEGPKSIVFDNIKIDFISFRTEKGGKNINMSKTEYKILKYFVSHRGEVISRETFLDKVWGYEKYPTTRTVDNFIVKLRSKIEKDKSSPKHLITVYGVGYKFVA